MSTSTSLVTGVDFVSVPTTDLEAAMDFYGDVLGLERSSVWQRPGQEPLGAEFETGTVTIALLACERLGIEFQPNKVPIALRVDDVEAARAELGSRGVEFKGDTIDSGVCHQAFFEDPDGNALDLHHRYAPRG
jgi:catechol 2,3-dioxygenase-like lactoylglutathione lyase family enzyme